MFQYILTLLNLHLGLPELTSQVSHYMFVNCLIRTCFSSFSSRRTSTISFFKDSSEQTFPSSPHVPFALLDAGTVQVGMAYRS